MAYEIATPVKLAATRLKTVPMPQIKHPTREFQAKSPQVFWSFPAKNLHDFDHLKRVPDHASQRLIHVGDERDHLFSHPLSGFNHEFGEKGSIFLTLHECPRSGLHVEDEPMWSGGANSTCRPAAS